ncbi:1-acyl-sn-glycerol-3-phosphate acyltransferase [Pedobacter sp. Du54]|uniref:lysophospholipid acyltransferase family protein n=1 Tax=Pedobacter anseongensis TaxID=3133439 RepID=UPI0030A65E5B
MIIKSKPLHPFFFWWGALFVGIFLKRRFNEIKINEVPIKPNHSYILMCNHFSFLDGFLAYYLSNKLFRKKNGMRKLYIMSVKKQMEKNWWLRYIGSFSIDPGKRSIEKSFSYAAEVLSEPGNLLLFYPQAKLESSHIRQIYFEDGLNQIIPQIKGECQLVWSSNIIEYFESTKPSLTYNLLDCGTNKAYDFEKVKRIVNLHHRASIEKNFRFTEEVDR